MAVTASVCVCVCVCFVVFYHLQKQIHIKLISRVELSIQNE